MLLGKLFGLGGQSKERSDSGSGSNQGQAVANGEQKINHSGKKAAAKQRIINQKLEDAFKGDFEDDEEVKASTA